MPLLGWCLWASGMDQQEQNVAGLPAGVEWNMLLFWKPLGQNLSQTGASDMTQVRLGLGWQAGSSRVDVTEFERIWVEVWNSY